MSEKFVEELLVICEELQPDGSSKISVRIEGDHEDRDPDEPISSAYAFAVGMFLLFKQGAVHAVLEKEMGYDFDTNDEVKLESGA